LVLLREPGLELLDPTFEFLLARGLELGASNALPAFSKSCFCQ